MKLSYENDKKFMKFFGNDIYVIKHNINICKKTLHYVKTHTYKQFVTNLMGYSSLYRYSKDSPMMVCGLVPGNDPSDTYNLTGKTNPNKIYEFSASKTDSLLPESIDFDKINRNALSKQDIINILNYGIKFWSEFLVKLPKHNQINTSLLASILEDTTTDMEDEDYGLAADDISALDTGECNLPHCLFTVALQYIKNDVFSKDYDSFYNDLSFITNKFPNVQFALM